MFFHIQFFRFLALEGIFCTFLFFVFLCVFFLHTTFANFFARKVVFRNPLDSISF
jgi:hypothetical protein